MAKMESWTEVIVISKVEPAHQFWVNDDEDGCYDHLLHGDPPYTVFFKFPQDKFRAGMYKALHFISTVRGTLCFAYDDQCALMRKYIMIDGHYYLLTNNDDLAFDAPSLTEFHWTGTIWRKVYVAGIKVGSEVANALSN